MNALAHNTCLRVLDISWYGRSSEYDADWVWVLILIFILALLVRAYINIGNIFLVYFVT